MTTPVPARNQALHGMRPIDAAPALCLRSLSVSFRADGQLRHKAVVDCSLTLYPGQTVAIVGESGSGKSVSMLAAAGLLPGSARIDSGSIRLRLNGAERELTRQPEDELQSIRREHLAMIFQEPMTSLNPVLTIGEQLREALPGSTAKAGQLNAVIKAMHDVGILEPARRLRSYPHEFSGGMRQRIMIAMAIARSPSVLLADEPTTALDVTIAAQVLSLLTDLRERLGMGMVLVTHDMGVVAQHADVVCVMYAGRVVEYANVFDLFASPLHPYTKGLLRAVPRLGAHGTRLATLLEGVEAKDMLIDLHSESHPAASHAEPLRAWWPGEAGEGELVQVRTGRWVRVLAGRAQGSQPDIALRVVQNLHTAG